MNLQHIIVGTDFSTEAEAARLQGINMAARTGAKLTMVHIVVPPELWLDAVTLNFEGGVDSRAIVATEVKAAKAKLDELCEPAARDAIDIDCRVEKGHPDTVLPDLARDLSADLVVVGTHGRTGFRRLTMGSVAERVTRLSPCSVLVARADGEGAGGYRSILVPTDFSESAELALELALNLVSPDGAIDIAHYWQTAFQAYGYYSGYEPPEIYRKRISDDVAAQGAELVRKYKPRHDRIAFLQAAESAPRGIVTQLETQPYDLVAMGSHGRRGVRRWIMGSVAENTVRHAPCSVLVARTH